MQSLAKKPFSYKPRFTPSDLVIGRRANETRYIPGSLVPCELILFIFSDRLDLDCSYSIAEAESRTWKADKPILKITTGKHTNKLLQVSAEFTKGNFPSLLDSLNRIRMDIRRIQGKVERDSVRKSYGLILDMLSNLESDIIKARIEIQDYFASSNTAEQ